uniref:Uncharacterized protein n=1 Tax=Fagus sylvatica TaxID=28930 RepID=A0A2N9FW55_FAGSY
MAISKSFSQTAPMMMCKISTVIQIMLSLMEDPTDDVQNQHGRPDDAFPDGRPETKKNSDDGRKTPVGCRPKFLRCLCQRFGGE